MVLCFEGRRYLTKTMTPLSAIGSTTNHVIDGRFLPDMDLLWMVKLVLYVLLNALRVSGSVSTPIFELSSLKS